MELQQSLLASPLPPFPRGLRTARQSWYSLPTEVMCMIAGQFLDLDDPFYQINGSGYSTPPQMDLSFAQIDRRARSAFIHALGNRQPMLEIYYSRGETKKPSNHSSFERNLRRFLPTSRFQNLCDMNNFSILRIDIGSSFPEENTEYRYRAVLPLTDESIMLLSAFIHDHTTEIKAIGLQPHLTLNSHKPVMIEAIQKMSPLFRNVEKTAIVMVPGSPVFFARDELTELRTVFAQTTEPLRDIAGLCTFYQPHQDLLEKILTKDNVPLRTLTPIIANLLSSWENSIKFPGFNPHQLDSRGMSGYKIYSNITSITMRSLAEFLLSTPNTKNHSRHHFLQVSQVGSITNGSPHFPPPNIHFENLKKCMHFANVEYAALSRLLVDFPTHLPSSAPQQLPHNYTPQSLARRLAIVQDVALLELALARYKTLPGVQQQFYSVRCDCRKMEQRVICSGIHQPPWEHWKRAKERAELVKKYRRILCRERMGPKWIKRWLRAFRDIEYRIMKSLTRWRSTDNVQIVRKPVTDFEGLEFVFQYAPT